MWFPCYRPIVKCTKFGDDRLVGLGLGSVNVWVRGVLRDRDARDGVSVSSSRTGWRGTRRRASE